MQLSFHSISVFFLLNLFEQKSFCFVFAISNLSKWSVFMNTRYHCKKTQKLTLLAIEFRLNNQNVVVRQKKDVPDKEHNKLAQISRAIMDAAGKKTSASKGTISQVVAKFKEQEKNSVESKEMIKNALQKSFKLVSKQKDKYAWKKLLAIFEFWESEYEDSISLLAFNCLLSALQKAKQYDGVKTYFMKLKSSNTGLIPDLYSFSALIRAHADEGKVSSCMLLVQEIEKMGMEPNKFIYTAVIGSCQKAGNSEQALRIISTMLEKGVTPDQVAFSAAISACEKGKDTEGALFLFYLMKEKGVPPNDYSYSAVIRACSHNSTHWKKAIEILEEIPRPKLSVFNAAISTCGAVGKFDEACQLLQKATQMGLKPDLITFNTIISACEKANKGEMALPLMAQMKVHDIVPDEITYNTAINALAVSKTPNKALGLFIQMEQEGLKKDQYTYNAVLAACARTGRYLQALNFMREMTCLGIKPNHISYLHAIDAARNARHPEIAFKLFREMKTGNIRPSKQIYTSLMAACSIYVFPSQSAVFGSEQALALLAEMIHEGIPPDVNAYAACARALASEGKSEEIASLVDKMHCDGISSNKYIYSSVMKTLEAKKDWTGVIQIFNQIRSKNKDEVDMVIYKAVLLACAAIGEVKTVMGVIKIKKACSKEPPDIEFFNLALKACESAGSYQSALVILKTMKEEHVPPDIESFNRAIASCQTEGAGVVAIGLLRQMRRLQLQPNVFTVAAVMRAFIKGNSESSVRRYLRFATSKVDAGEQEVLYVAAIQAYYSFGMYDRAAELFERSNNDGLLGSNIKNLVDEAAKNSYPTLVIDLHGLQMPVAHAAIHCCLKLLWIVNQENPETVPNIEIVTGIGRHSVKQFDPVIRPKVQNMLQEEFYPPIHSSTKPGNTGRVVIEKTMILEWIKHNVATKLALIRRLNEVLKERLN